MGNEKHPVLLFIFLSPIFLFALSEICLPFFYLPWFSWRCYLLPPAGVSVFFFARILVPPISTTASVISPLSFLLKVT